MVEYNKITPKKTKVVNPGDVPMTKKTAIVKGSVKKPGLLSRAGNLFFGDGGFRGIMDHLVHEVFIPSIQNTVVDVATSSIKRAVLGEDYVSTGRGRGERYDRYYRGGYRSSRLEASRGAGHIDYDERYHSRSQNTSDVVKTIAFTTYEDAYDVLTTLDDNIQQFDIVSVADYYELSDVGSKFTDHQFGWTDLRSAQIVAGRNNKWYIKLPRPVAI